MPHQPSSSKGNRFPSRGRSRTSRSPTRSPSPSSLHHASHVKVVDLVDYGSGAGFRVMAERKKHPHSTIVAVDRGYSDKNIVRSPVDILEKMGIEVHALSFRAHLQKMVRENTRTKSLMIDMLQRHFSPHEGVAQTRRRDIAFRNQVRTIVDYLPHVLVPGGFFHVISENANWLEEIAVYAKGRKLAVYPIRKVRAAEIVGAGQDVQDYWKKGTPLFSLILVNPA